tara:strand:+ start:6779 stop:7021 length:243 start_codon:yes stop_codon:yes gene_type:complete
MNDMILLKWNIRNVCHMRGVRTQKKLSDISGADKNLVNDIWNSRQRNITTETLGKICVALNCTPSDILNFELAMPVRSMK